MNLETDSVDAQLFHHIKGDVSWALGPKAKHEKMGRQGVKKAKRHQSTRSTKTVQEDVLTHKKCNPQQSPILHYQTRRQQDTR